MKKLLHLLIIFISSVISAAYASPSAPIAGVDYQVLTTTATPMPAGKVEVIEFFWYGCPHCAAFEPILTAWLKKQGPNVVFKTVPVAFSRDFTAHQRLYHTVDTLGVAPQLTPKIFEEIQRQRNYLLTEEAQADFIAKQGIDKKRFLDTYHSFKVSNDIKQDNQLIAKYRINSVPTLIVQGQYKTSPSMTQSLAGTVKVLDFLVQQSNANKMATKPLTVSVCTEASPEGFDVVQYNSLVTTNASADLIFNGLVALDEVTHQIVPALAQQWDISEDGLTYTFRLRPNVPFQTTRYFKPTRPLNADDVIFTFERMLNPQHPWHKMVGPAGFPHAQAMQLPALVKAIDKVGDDAVRFTLNEPNATFLPMLTMGFASIYSAEYANQLVRDHRMSALNTQPIGTGAWMLRSYQKDAMIRYEANPHYWGPRPKFDRLIYVITPDAAVRIQKLKAGECEIALSPRPQDILAAKRDKSIQVAATPAFMTAFVALNTQHPPLNNPKVRQAINRAFDREAYLKTVFEGTATSANNPYPQTTWGYAKQIQPYPYHPAQAKKQLAEAGFPKGFETTIWIRPTGSALNPNPKTGAELLQADLAKIGIKARVKVMEWGELIRKAKQGQHDLLFMGWAGDNGDPDNFLSPQFSCAAVQSGTNFSRFCNRALDQLIAEAKRTTNRAQRVQKYIAAQKIIHEQALWLPLGYPTAAVLMQNKVSGYRVSPFGRQNFTAVAIH